MSDPNLPPKLDESSQGNPRGNWFMRLPTWGKWTVGIVAALLLIGIGAAIGGGSNKEGDLKDEVATLEGQVVKAEASAKEAEAAANKAEGAEREEVKAGEEKARRLVNEANVEADKIKGAAGKESEHLSEKVTAQESELESLEGEACSVESKIANLRGEEGEAKEIKAKSTIPGNGTFRAEVDYIPGIYESSGGNYCYWATLNSADNFDIVNNENATGPTIAEITTPYFQTKECGTWHKIE